MFVALSVVTQQTLSVVFHLSVMALRIAARLIAVWDSSTCFVDKTADLKDQSDVMK